MRCAVLFLACGLAGAQVSDPAYAPLARAYEALRGRDYETAVAGFREAIDAAPGRAAIRTDLAYTYLKIGENEMAREQFREAMRLEPENEQAALEYAFLCNEAMEQAEARRIFDRVRRAGNPVAEQAFRNIDGPLDEGIRRWTEAIARGSDNFSAHFELATLSQQRDELGRAAEHFEKAWRLLPDRRSVLVDLGRVWLSQGRLDEANAALLAASRGGEPRAAERARELLPDRYPFVAEFRRALTLDPHNFEMRRELGYLLLRMDRQPEAEQEFLYLTQHAPADMLAAAQLGFLLLGRGESAAAMPLFERVLAGPDEEMANRVRAVLHLPQVLTPRSETKPASIDAKVMAERSAKAGYMRDALKYLQIAHEAEPGDFDVMLQLGWAYNILHQDRQAVRWFDLARRSTDPRLAAEATGAWKNLRGATRRFHITAWAFPIYSSRWRDLFSYGQIKAELRAGRFLRPYLSTRFAGDTRVTMGAASPQFLSESSFIVGAGIASTPWHGIVGWGEAGSAMSYVNGHMLPDYRGGISIARTFGTHLGGEKSGYFASSATDGVFISRFGNDFLVYQQTRFGYGGGARLVRAQFYANVNLTIDSQRQGWANFIETGPGIRFRTSFMPTSMFLLFDAMRGAYLIRGASSQGNFTDIRLGMWYAVTR